MSTNTEHYAMVAVDVKKIFNERDIEDPYITLERYMDDKGDDIYCLFDGMNEEYILLGKVVAHGDEFEGFPLTNISIERFSEVKKEVSNFLMQTFNIEDEPQFFIVTHWR